MLMLVTNQLEATLVAKVHKEAYPAETEAEADGEVMAKYPRVSMT